MRRKYQFKEIISAAIPTRKDIKIINIEKDSIEVEGTKLTKELIIRGNLSFNRFVKKKKKKHFWEK